MLVAVVFTTHVGFDEVVEHGVSDGDIIRI